MFGNPNFHLCKVPVCCHLKVLLVFCIHEFPQNLLMQTNEKLSLVDLWKYLLFRCALAWGVFFKDGSIQS